MLTCDPFIRTMTFILKYCFSSSSGSSLTPSYIHMTQMKCYGYVLKPKWSVFSDGFSQGQQSSHRHVPTDCLRMPTAPRDGMCSPAGADVQLCNMTSTLETESKRSVFYFRFPLLLVSTSSCRGLLLPIVPLHPFPCPSLGLVGCLGYLTPGTHEVGEN